MSKYISKDFTCSIQDILANFNDLLQKHKSKDNWLITEARIGKLRKMKSGEYKLNIDFYYKLSDEWNSITVLTIRKDGKIIDAFSMSVWANNLLKKFVWIDIYDFKYLNIN